MGATPPVADAPRIFLSSTHADLANERVIVWQALRLCGIDVVRSEDFTRTGDEPSWEACKRELLRCDGYLLLIGDKYGSSIPNSNLTFTQAEYELARKRQLPVWVFMKHGVVPAGPGAARYRDFIAAVSNARMRSAEFGTPQDLASAVEKTFATMKWATPGARPRFGKQAAKQKKAVVNDPLKYAVGQVRQRVMAHHPFTTVLVDTASVDRLKLREDDPRRLLESGQSARDDISELGVAVRFLQDIWEIAGSEDERAAKRIAKAADTSSVIVCLVTGEGDYPEVRQFEQRTGQLGSFRPEHVPEERVRADHQDTYTDEDLTDGRLTEAITDYVGAELDAHLATEY